jgi:hypothetical protein
MGILLRGPGDGSTGWYYSPEWWLFIIAVPSLYVVARQAVLMKRHAEHLNTLSKSTADAARAMESSVEVSRDTAKRQLRAYLTVSIGAGVYQVKTEGLRFEGKPTVTNSGQTPAYKVRLQTKAAILPLPLPRETSLSEIGDEEGETTLGVQQVAIMSCRVDNFSHDEEVESIKAGSKGRSLYVWGIIFYEDVFGDEHYTRFCHQIIWLQDGTIYGNYTPGRNQAT